MLLRVVRSAGGVFRTSPSRTDTKVGWEEVAQQKLLCIHIQAVEEMGIWQKSHALGGTGVLIRRITEAILSENTVRRSRLPLVRPRLHSTHSFVHRRKKM
jgi:hypothetical protein